MNIIALDLGVNTGVCWNPVHGQVTSVAWQLATAKETKMIHMKRLDRTLDPRIVRFWALLEALIRPYGLGASSPYGLIIFEDVEFAKSLRQCQLWSSFRTVVWMTAHLHSIACQCIPVGTLKKFATGNGHAEKPDMRKALENYATFKHRVNDMTDDEVDATFLWIWANQHHNQKMAL